MTIMANYIDADENLRRDYHVAPKEQAIFANLSGKRTLVGRSSGECFVIRKPPKGKADSVNFQVQGQRPLFL